MIKMAIIDSRPNIYKIGIWKQLHKSILIDSHVYFLSNSGINDKFYDKEFNSYRKSDEWLLNDFKFSFPKNYSRFKNEFLMFIAPKIFFDILLKKYDVVLVQGYNYFMYLFAIILARLSGTKVIFRGEAVLRGDENQPTLKNLIKKYYIKFILKISNAVMYSCSGNKDYYQYYGVNLNKLYPIPCAVDNKFYYSEYIKHHSHRNILKDDLDIDRNSFVIIFLARFTKRKRPLDLLRAVKEIDNKDITILFVGDGPEMNNMKNFANENNIKAIFTGFKEQKDLSRYYSISDACVIVSDYDPSPKVMNEAMNFKLPIIVTKNIGTAKDLVKNDYNGYIIENGDIYTLSKKINYLNKNPNLKYIMGKNSLKIVQAWSFEKDVMYIEKVADIITGPKSKS